MPKPTSPKKGSSKKVPSAGPEKAEKKSVSKSTEGMIPVLSEGDAPNVDMEELEEAQEEAAAAASQGGNAAALAAANNSTEMSASFKNFRHHPDMENFYRFIFENDLRQEALAIIDLIMADKQQKKNLKSLKQPSH